MHGDPDRSLERVTPGGRVVEFTVSCRACGALHGPADGLAFAPGCDACDENERRAFRPHGGVDALDDRRHPARHSGGAWACPIHG